MVGSGGGWYGPLDDVGDACARCAGGDAGCGRRGVNSSTTSAALTVDTVAPAVAITTRGGDSIVNAAEAAGGIGQRHGGISSTLTVNGSAVVVDGTASGRRRRLQAGRWW
jgi:hypothetical protein